MRLECRSTPCDMYLITGTCLLYMEPWMIRCVHSSVGSSALNSFPMLVFKRYCIRAGVVARVGGQPAWIISYCTRCP